MSLAMLEAAIASTRSGSRIVIDQVLEQAHATALAAERAERDDATSERLAAWGSVRNALSGSVATAS